MARFVFAALVLSVLVIRPVEGQPVIERPDSTIQRLVAAVSADTIEANVRRLVAFGTRHTLSNTRSTTQGIGAARRWIRSTLERYARAGGGRMQVSFDSYLQRKGATRIDRDVEITNVLARLPGTDPADDRIFIITGHYDTRVNDVMDSTTFQPGASDDASGTAAVMEMARVLAGEQFPATILFAAVAAEEQGLFGARHLALVADSLGWNVAGMITLDIVGNTLGDDGTRDNRTIRLFSEGFPEAEIKQPAARLRVGGENDSPSRQFARYLEEVGERYVPHMDVKQIFRRDRFLRGGDHIPFLERGYAGVRMTEPHEAFTRQHQVVRVANDTAYGDVPDMVDYPYTADVARVNLASLANLAMAPAAPDSTFILVAGLDVDTRLRWTASPTPNRVAGYYVLVRETTSPVWQRKIFVGNVMEYRLKGVSKDDHYFGVQAVSPGGHESLIVFPQPAQR